MSDVNKYINKISDLERENSHLIDHLDHIRDELIRISVNSSISEIKQLCERAIVGIEYHVPVIEQRDRACAILDAIKTSIANWSHPDGNGGSTSSALFRAKYYRN